MNLRHVWRFGEAAPTVAVAIARMPEGNTHVGIVYRLRDGSESSGLLHLAFHKLLMNDPVDSLVRWPGLEREMVCIVPEMEELEQANVAIMCRGIARDMPELPYGLTYNDDGYFDFIDGNFDLILPEDRRWLNCSTFVLTVFKSTGPAILDAEDWPARPIQDRDWQIQLAKWLWKRSDCKHIKRILPGIGRARIRPEEAAGACLEDELPARFEQCEPNGQVVLELIDGKTSVSAEIE
jgi:hypothetical protein